MRNTCISRAQHNERAQQQEPRYNMIEFSSPSGALTALMRRTMSEIIQPKHLPAEELQERPSDDEMGPQPQIRRKEATI